MLYHVVQSDRGRPAQDILGNKFTRLGVFLVQLRLLHAGNETLMMHREEVLTDRTAAELAHPLTAVAWSAP